MEVGSMIPVLPGAVWPERYRVIECADAEKMVTNPMPWTPSPVAGWRGSTTTNTFMAFATRMRALQKWMQERFVDAELCQ